MELKRIRKESGLTQVQVAEHLGVSQQTYSGYERGYRDLNSDILVKCAKLFGCTTDDILGTKFAKDREIIDITDLSEEKKNFIREYISFCMKTDS